MGGCASRPKVLGSKSQVPAEVPSTTPEVPGAMAETVPQENHGGEEKKEEPLLDISVPAEEANAAGPETTPEVTNVATEDAKTAEPEITTELVTNEEKSVEPKEEAAVVEKKEAETKKPEAAEEPAKKPEAVEATPKSIEKTEVVAPVV